MIIGGYNGGIVYNTAELYHPSTRIWTIFTNINHPRKQHTTILLKNETTLVNGGSDGFHSFQTVELYQSFEN